MHQRHSRGKSTALKHFCKCFILHVTTSKTFAKMLQKMGGASSQSVLCYGISAQHDVIIMRANETL